MFTKRKIVNCLQPVLNQAKRAGRSRYLVPICSIVIAGGVMIALVSISATDQNQVRASKPAKVTVNQISKTLNQQSQTTSAIKARLIAIDQSLNALSEQKETTPSVDIIQPLARIEAQLKRIDQDANTSGLRLMLTTSTQDLTGLMSHLQMSINQLRERLYPKALLPVSKLPFEVIGIDLWNGQAKASIRSHHQVAPPMMVGDRKDGWTLTHLQFSPAFARFDNQAKQQIEVRL